VILALSVPSVVRIWYAVGTAIVPGLLVPLMASYSILADSRPLRILGDAARMVDVDGLACTRTTESRQRFAGLLAWHRADVSGACCFVVIWGMGRSRKE